MNIYVKQIEKKFDKKIVLNKISLVINSNSIYCLLGTNGAGKTTLINILSDLIEANSGEIQFDNLNYKYAELEIKRNIGLLSEASSLMEELSGFEYLTFVGKLYKLSKEKINERIDGLVSYFFDDLDDIKKLISNYSTGMKKKLMFCASIIHKPNILILDEPFSGLDPVAANLLVVFLNKYLNRNRIIFLSSHNLNYVEKVATHIGVLANGEILFDGTLKSFLEDGAKTIDDSLLDKLSKTSAKIKDVEWAF